MSVNVYDPVNDTLIPVAGATLYADTPIGAIQAFDAEEVPDGWLIFNGQTVLRSDYPDLWARANRNGQVGVDKFFSQGDGSTTFTLADLRETSLKGYGETSRAVGAHVKSGGLAVGEFIDDQLQNITGSFKAYTYGNGTPTGAFESQLYDPNSIQVGTSPDYNYVAFSFDASKVARTGTTTEVKAVGVVWAVKAKQVGLPIDLKEQVRKQMFPDYAHPITVPATNSWTATEDCYVMFHWITLGDSSNALYLDGDRVDTWDSSSYESIRTYSVSFNGYIKKGQVLSLASGHDFSSNSFKAFPLTA
jgi:microcystin-dependent protein